MGAQAPALHSLPAPPAELKHIPPAGSPKAASAFVRNTKGLMRTVGSFIILGSSKNTCCSGDRTGKWETGRWRHVLALMGAADWPAAARITTIARVPAAVAYGTE